ncbi:MAG: transketolase C-terminal domain-containing protein, partial [Actinomycetota bacterium]
EGGRGYVPAERDEADRFRGVSLIHPNTATPLPTSGPTWTGAFGDELVALGRENPRLVAITAAMLGPTGLDRFARAFPERTFDVGIAEQHAATSAAGLAYAGMHPVVAVYATFLNRAFDQVLLDCALHRAGVTFVLDRAGVTGDDGPSHNGMWDITMLGIVPGLRLAAPRDGETLREELREAVGIDDGPTVVRFPKGALASEIPAVERVDGIDVLRADADSDVLIVSVGAFAGMALDVADRLADQGVPVSVVDPRWVLPVNPALARLASDVSLVVTVEDNLRVGGFGSAVRQMLADQGVRVPVRDFGIPPAFPDQAPRARLHAAMGLTAQDISRQVVEAVAALLPDDSESIPQEG